MGRRHMQWWCWGKVKLPQSFSTLSNTRLSAFHWDVFQSDQQKAQRGNRGIILRTWKCRNFMHSCYFHNSMVFHRILWQCLRCKLGCSVTCECAFDFQLAPVTWPLILQIATKSSFSSWLPPFTPLSPSQSSFLSSSWLFSALPHSSWQSPSTFNCELSWSTYLPSIYWSGLVRPSSSWAGVVTEFSLLSFCQQSGYHYRCARIHFSCSLRCHGVFLH